jgi:drug/metabolite transporter (DMT)-like permease
LPVRLSVFTALAATVILALFAAHRSGVRTALTLLVVASIVPAVWRADFRWFPQRWPFFTAGTYNDSFMTSVWLGIVSIAAGEPSHFDFAAISSRSFMAWCYLIVAGSLIGFTTFVWLMKHSTPARVSTYAYVNPIVAVFLGWLIAHEEVGIRMFFAAAIIVAGVAIITASKNKKPTVATATAVISPARTVPVPAVSESKNS